MKKYIFFSLIFTVLALNNANSQVADKYLIKAGILANVNSYEEASTAINQTSATDNKKYNKIAGDVYYGLKDYQKALEFYNNSEKNESGSSLLEIARCYAMIGNSSKSVENLKKYFSSKNKLPISKIVNDAAFTKYKNDAEWLSLWQNVDYSEVEKVINQVNSASEMDYNEYFSKILDDALAKYPNNPELIYKQSKYLESKNLLDASLKSINRALELKSTNDLFHFQKSNVLTKKQNYKEALTSINNALARNPFKLEYYLLRIEINRILGNNNKVSEDVSFIDFCAPESVEVRLAKTKIEYEKGNYLTALKEISALIQNDQSKVEYYILRGNIGLKSKKLKNADEDFGMALDLNPLNAEANLGKALAKYQMEDKKSACYYWQKASNEGNREAKELLNKYCGN